MIARHQKIIIYATYQKLIVSLWHGKQYQSQQTYQNQQVDYAAFRDYLSQHKKATIEVIVDAVEEEYQLEVLPHVAKSARRAMLERKLSQFNRNSVYKTAWLMRQQTSARKEDVFVLLSLTNTGWLQNWIDMLLAEQSLLVGIYALPVLTQCMVQQMKSVAPQLLICEHLASGFRQTYFEHGILRISRLMPIESMPSSSLVDCYLAEIEKMRMYLLSQRIISDATILQVALSHLKADGHMLLTRLAQQGLACINVNWQTGFKKTHSEQTDVCQYPEWQYMRLLNGISQPANLAPVEMTKAYDLTQLTNRIDITALVVLLMGLFISASLYLQGIQQAKQINDLTRQTDTLAQQRTFVINQSPPSPLAGRDLKAVVTMTQMLSEPSPITMMQVISKVLTAMPEVSLSRIRWLQSDLEKIADEENSDFGQQPNREDGRHDRLLQIGFVTVHINQLTDDNQQALAYVNQLVNQLRADSHVSAVDVIQLPVDAQLQTTQGSTSDQLATLPSSVMVKLKITLSQVRKEGL